MTDEEKTTAPSRRALIGWGGAGLALGAAAAGGAVAMTRTGDDIEPTAAEAGAAVEFHGAHQAGIATPVQDRLHFAAFDVTTEDRAEFVQMLKEWTAAARRMTAGKAVGEGAYGGLAEAPPDDTGEALGLKPSRLTLTIGFGPSLFEKFDLADRRPEALVDLPQFAGDNLDKNRSGGDLCVQACADDPQVAVHAIRNLARIGFGKVVIKWSQLGFGKTSSTTPDAQTPRNLMGFKDGTRNIAGTETDRLKKFVWVDSAKDAKDAPWMNGGSYLVARRIRMHIETWDRTSLQEQEDVFGRDKGEGAPVGKAKERDKPFLPHDEARRARPARAPRLQPRGDDPAPRLLLHRRHRRPRPAGGGPVLPRVPEGRPRGLHPDPAPSGHGRAQRVHPACGFGGLRRPARRP